MEVIVRPSVGRIGSIVPLDGAIFLVIPGTSCLATIVLSLRDKTNRHRSASLYLRAPWVNPGLFCRVPRLGVLPGFDVGQHVVGGLRRTLAYFTASSLRHGSPAGPLKKELSFAGPFPDSRGIDD